MKTGLTAWKYAWYCFTTVWAIFEARTVSKQISPYKQSVTFNWILWHCYRLWDILRIGGPNDYQNIATGLAKSERSAEPLPHFPSKFCVLPYELGIFKLSRLAKYILRNLVHRGIQKLREKTALGKQKIMANIGLRILKNNFICLI